MVKDLPIEFGNFDFECFLHPQGRYFSCRPVEKSTGLCFEINHIEMRKTKWQNGLATQYLYLMRMKEIP
jgi:hypothetical protein